MPNKYRKAKWMYDTNAINMRKQLKTTQHNKLKKIK